MSKRITKEELNAELAPRGLALIGELLGVRSKGTFQCAHGHQWTATVDGVRRVSGCPTCAGFGQTRDTVNAQIAPRGLRLLEDFKSTKYKGRFECAQGHQWRAVIQSVSAGRGCPHCAGQITPSWAEIAPEFSARGIELTGDYVDLSTRTTFKHIECGHEWRTKPKKIRSGQGCPKCAGILKLTPADVNERIAARGIELIGELKNARTKALFRATCGHEWHAVPYEVMNGTGCPECVTVGVFAADESYVYVMDYAGLSKIGVSNAPHFRRRKLQEHTRDPITLIAAFQFEEGTGRAAWRAEQEAHKYFADRHAGLTGFTGATELFKITPAEAYDYLHGAGGRAVALESLNG